MNIRGIVKFSLIDFPGKMSAILFVGNCNFRCPYCHNPHLVFDPESQPEISKEEVLSFLDKRRGKLDGIVISGGEPSLQPDLIEFIKQIKEMGFLVKLDTNCSKPDIVIDAIYCDLIDHLGIDYKAPVDNYTEITYFNKPDIGNRVHKVIKKAIDHKIDIDVRTTVHKSLLSYERLKQIRCELDELGVQQWTLQQFNPVDIIDDDLIEEETFSDRDLIEMASILGNKTRVRGLRGRIL